MAVMEPILTIIVPSYRTERFLSYTLCHYAEIVKTGLVNVVFVDDGSTDKTGPLLLEFVNSHQPYCFYFKKDNGGHGSVINFAVYNVVRTKYFRVVDGDDYVDESQLSFFLDELAKTDADVVIDNYSTQVIGQGKKDETPPFSAPGTINIDRCCPSLPIVTYRTALWVQNNIRLTERVYYDDMGYVLFPFAFAKTASYLPFCSYVVVTGHSGQSTAPNNVILHLYDKLTVLSDIVSFDSLLDSPKASYCVRSRNICLQLFESYVHFSLFYSTSVFSCLRHFRVLKHCPFYKGLFIYSKKSTQQVLRIGLPCVLSLRAARKLKSFFRNLRDRSRTAPSV